MIKAIIFDFAGVIAIDGYMIWLRETDPKFDKNKKYYQEISDKVDRADITNKEFVDLISKKTSVSSKIIWDKIFKKIFINYELLHQITNLKKKYKIGLLSNYTFEWLDELFLRYNLSTYFNEVVISSRYKIIKPDPKIFQIMIDLLKVKKDEVIFIDDRQYNVDAGNNLGIKSFLYSSNEKLVEVFRKLNIL